MSGWKGAVSVRALVDEREERAPACPLCGGQGVLLGRLGSRAWWRCHGCGIGFSTTAPAEGQSRGSRREG